MKKYDILLTISVTITNLITWESLVLGNLPGGSTISVKLQVRLSFQYENHCDSYKKLASRSWPMLFTLTYFFLMHILSSSAGKEKVAVITVFLSKLDGRSMFNCLY